MTSDPTDAARRTYSYLGPAGTFTEAALAQVPEARGQDWRSVRNVGEALADVVEGRSDAAMIAIENSIDGGVSTAQDALATMPGLRIVGEYLVPVDFVLVARPGTKLEDVSLIAAHPVAYAQCLQWLDADAARARAHPRVEQRRERRGPARRNERCGCRDRAARNPRAPRPRAARRERSATTRTPSPGSCSSAARSRRPPPTGADKTSLIAELPDDHPGALLEMLEQFATRGINLSLLASRPIGDALGRYRFVIDADGHIEDERMADALLGLRRFSPKVVFLGSYPRADRAVVHYPERYSDDVFVEARDWLRGLVSGEPEA